MVGSPSEASPSSMARAKPALEADHHAGMRFFDGMRAIHGWIVPLSSAGFAGATIPGEVRKGAKPPSELNVQEVRLALGSLAAPCSWTPLLALAALAHKLLAPIKQVPGSHLSVAFSS